MDLFNTTTELKKDQNSHKTKKYFVILFTINLISDISKSLYKRYCVVIKPQIILNIFTMDVTDVIGGFGSFQLRLLLITGLRSFCSTFMRYSYNYITRSPDFECDTSTLYFGNYTNGNASSVYVWDYARERDRGSMEECYIQPGYHDDLNNSTASMKPCEKFMYDPVEHSTTVVEEWDLVCWNTWIVTFGYMLYSIGGFVTYIPSGIISDKYGRRPMVLIGQIIVCITTTITAFSSSANMFMALRFALAVGHGMLGSSASCLFMETVGPEKRHVTVIFMAVGGFSSIILAGVAYFVHDWRTLVLIASFPVQIPLLLAIWKFMPESTRWLLTAKKYEKAELQIVEQAKINGITVIDKISVMKNLKDKIEAKDEKQPGSIMEVLKNRKVRHVAVIVYITYAIRAVINGGFTISLNQLGGSFHLNMCILGLSRIIIASCNFYIVKNLNRKKVIFSSFLVTGILFLASAPIPKHLLWLKITLSMMGNLVQGLSSSMLYLLVIEMFPTKMRVSALTGAKISSRLGNLAAPLADLAGRLYGKYIPLVLYGGLAIACCFILLALPETKHEQLPDTVRDFEKLHSKKDNDDKTKNGVI